MEIRKVRKKDIPEISDISKICFDKPMIEKNYSWLYSHHDGFCSYVMLDSYKIIAHQAFIERKYSYNGKHIIIGLSSASMILPEYQKSGDFYYLLKESIGNFNGDMIIGFPNENSHGIFRKLFKFECVPHNLFQLDLNNNLNYPDSKYYDPFMRNDMDWRLNRHPVNHYKKVEKGDCRIIYKEYTGNSVDILYVNVIDNNFVDIISGFSQKYSFVNIININGEQLERIGFKNKNGNEFVYKAFNKEYEQLVFPCQMIDSDVY
jgi:hypothetical protein